MKKSREEIADMDIIWVTEILFARRNDKGELAFLTEKNPPKQGKKFVKPIRLYVGNLSDPIEQLAQKWEREGHRPFEIAEEVARLVKERAELFKQAFGYTPTIVKR